MEENCVKEDCSRYVLCHVTNSLSGKLPKLIFSFEQLFSHRTIIILLPLFSLFPYLFRKWIFRTQGRSSYYLKTLILFSTNFPASRFSLRFTFCTKYILIYFIMVTFTYIKDAHINSKYIKVNEGLDYTESK